MTGFGLLGHLNELCLASGVGAELEAAAVPAIGGVLELAANERAIAGGSRRNREQAQAFAGFADDVAEERRVLLTDAMTSGGLLIAVAPEAAAAIEAPVIGRLVAEHPGRIEVR